jgi:hypothetical protein
MARTELASRVRPSAAPRGAGVAPTALRRQAVSWPGAVVAGLTLVALLLRLVLLRDSLFGDELYMFRIVHDRTLADVLSVVRETEKTPPLFFVVEWGAVKVGDPTVWLRVPSLIFGTALVPLAYILGLRTVGRAAALVASAILAIDPFAIFYATEGRAYALLAFLAGLSTLSLLSALETDRRRWWIAYVLTTLAILYTHYMGVFVVAAQAGWAFWVHHERRRELLVANGLITLALLPWIPSFLVQLRHSDDQARRIALIEAPSVEQFAEINGQAMFGHPLLTLGDLPGRGAVAVGAGVILGAAVAAAIRAWRRRGDLRMASPIALLSLLAIATPTGVALYSVVRPHMSFLLARNLSPSLPAVALLVGWLLASLGRRAAIPAVAVSLCVLGVGAAQMLEDDHRRPSYRDVARFIEARARPGDPVIDYSILQGPLALPVYFERSHPIFRSGETEDRAWKRGRRGARVFVIFPTPGAFEGVRRLGPRAGPGKQFVLVRQRRYPGVVPVLAGEYAFRRQ